jgi:hypothetical protein
MNDQERFGPGEWHPTDTERCENEPKIGGLPRFEAIEKWGSQPLLNQVRTWKQRFTTGEILGRKPDDLERRIFNVYLDESFCRCRIEVSGCLNKRATEFHSWLESNYPVQRFINQIVLDFDERWHGGEFSCFGFLSSAYRRIAISSSIRHSLEHDTDGRAFGVEKELFLDVLFYRAAAREIYAEEPLNILRAEGGKPPPETTKFRGDKQKVWEEAQRLGRPKAGRGEKQKYINEIARRTGFKADTVRNYISKRCELGHYINLLPDRGAVDPAK